MTNAGFRRFVFFAFWGAVGAIVTWAVLCMFVVTHFVIKYW